MLVPGVQVKQGVLLPDPYNMGKKSFPDLGVGKMGEILTEFQRGWLLKEPYGWVRRPESSCDQRWAPHK